MNTHARVLGVNKSAGALQADGGVKTLSTRINWLGVVVFAVGGPLTLAWMAFLAWLLVNAIYVV